MSIKQKFGKKLNILTNKYLLNYNEEPVIYENYIDALIRNGNYFYNDINKCVDPYGFSYVNWHYFSSIVNDIEKFSEEDIISNFKTYLEIIFHEDVYSGFRLKFEKSEGLKKFAPPILPFITPWSPFNVESVEKRVIDIIKTENLFSGQEENKINPLINPDHLALNHYNRLVQLRRSILSKGYNFLDDKNDHVKGYILSRGNDYRVLIFSGQHRVATLAGLKYKRIPLKFVYKYIIRYEDVNDWPLVKSGLWYRADALLYFNNLFDFDSHTWASDNGLILKNKNK